MQTGENSIIEARRRILCRSILYT